MTFVCHRLRPYGALSSALASEPKLERDDILIFGDAGLTGRAFLESLNMTNNAQSTEHMATIESYNTSREANGIELERGQTSLEHI